MIHKEIEKLIPYISENFITYPLWEEGKFIPQLNFWRICESKEFGAMLDMIDDINIRKYYSCVIEASSERIDTKISIMPVFEETEDGGYKFVKEDWSIEEMIDIALKIVSAT